MFEPLSPISSQGFTRGRSSHTALKEYRNIKIDRHKRDTGSLSYQTVHMFLFNDYKVLNLRDEYR